MKTLLTFAATVGFIYLLLVAFYAVMQRNLIYYPATLGGAEARAQAEALGGAAWLDEEGHWLGWKIEPIPAASPGPRRRAIVFHGNAGMALHRGYYGSLLNALRASGPWTVYVNEYPGYGPRGGAPGQQDFVEAAVSAIDQLIADDPTPLLLVGESIGSGVASAAVRERPEAVGALMLITPFDSLVSVAKHHMPWLPSRWLLRDRYNNLDALANYQGPLVVVTAGEDDVVPAVLAEPLVNQHAGALLHEHQAEAGHNSLQFQPGRAPWPTVDRFLADSMK